MENLDSLRRLSFGNPCMTEPIESERVSARLAGVSAGQAREVSAHVRSTCSLSATIDRLEAVYARALSCPVSVNAESLAAFASGFLDRKTQAYKLGRKTQEFWHDQREPDQPDTLDALKVDRILDGVFNATSKLAAANERAEKWKAKADELRAQTKKPEAESSGGIGDRIGRLFRGKK